MMKFEKRRLLQLINLVQSLSTTTYFTACNKRHPNVVTTNNILVLVLSSVSFSVSADNPKLISGIANTPYAQHEFKFANKKNLPDIKPKQVNFRQEAVSYDAQYLADWIIDSNNNDQMPFVIVDKKKAKVFVFNSYGELHGAAPALIGLAVGDTSTPNIGNMALASIKPEQRTTPAGRFVASLGKNLHNKEVLWVDYDGAISLHRVVTSSPKERRLQRLESANPLEHRISYGCINVPVDFYEKVVSPTFTGTNGVVYVLPDTRVVKEVFGSYSVVDRTPEH